MNDGGRDKLHEECGVVGVWGHAAAAEASCYALNALKHFGQESAGTISRPSDGKLHERKDLGLASKEC